jgi:DNA invertase Pin-like site-specific DNA recombinase
MAGRPEIKLDTDVVKRMYSDGVKIRLIAQYCGVSTNKIRKTRDSLNLPLRKIRKVVYNENAFKRLFEARVTYNEMAKILRMSRCSVIVIKKRLGLPNRNILCKKVQHDR